MLSNALKRIDAMKDPKDSVELLTEIAGRFLERGLKEKALELLKRASVMAEKIKDSYEEDTKGSMIREIAEVYAKAGKCKLGIETAIRGANADYTLTQIAKDCELPEEYGDIVASVKGMKWDDRKSELLEVMSVKYAKMGEIERALELVKEIPYPSHRAMALIEIGNVFLEKNRTPSDKEKKLLEEIVQ
jgi:tetratricopeptide (TPR) repeat protein